MKFVVHLPDGETKEFIFDSKDTAKDFFAILLEILGEFKIEVFTEIKNKD